LNLREAVDFMAMVRACDSENLLMCWLTAGRSLREEAILDAALIEAQERIMERELLRRRLLRRVGTK